MKQIYEKAISKNNASCSAPGLLSLVFVARHFFCKRIINNKDCLGSSLFLFCLFIQARIYACGVAGLALLHSLCLALVDKLWHKKRHLLHSIAVLYSGYVLWLINICLSQIDNARNSRCSLLHTLGRIFSCHSWQRDSHPLFHQEITSQIKARRAQSAALLSIPVSRFTATGTATPPLVAAHCAWLLRAWTRAAAQRSEPKTAFFGDASLSVAQDVRPKAIMGGSAHEL